MNRNGRMCGTPTHARRLKLSSDLQRQRLDPMANLHLTVRVRHNRSQQGRSVLESLLLPAAQFGENHQR
jgi:hypothetical protein